jgi:hypothetical protein
MSGGAEKTQHVVTLTFYLFACIYTHLHISGEDPCLRRRSMRRMGIGRGMLSSLLLSSALLLVAMPARCSGWTASATTNVELVKNLQRDG